MACLALDLHSDPVMRSLKDIFSRALRASMVAPAALAATACGAIPLPVVGYTAPTCIDLPPGNTPRLAVTGLSPSVIPDVIELRWVFNRGSSITTVAKTGDACKTATNVDACKSAFAALAPSTGFGATCTEGCIDYHLATTLKDDVKAWASDEALLSFLGSIDTGQEAMLVTLSRGYAITCGDPSRSGFKATATGFDVIATKGFACGKGSNLTRHFLSVSKAGVVTETGSDVLKYGADTCAVGRRPNGLVSSGAMRECDDVLGEFFSEIAHLEAASITAFEQIEKELIASGAPRDLVAAARRSALEEVVHARLTSRLAKRFGAVPPTPRIQETPPRSLFELAIDNASEGCVRETFGALVAAHQATTATDRDIRTTMTLIAADETRHAELSWSIDAWARTQLSAAQLEQVDAARRDSLASLKRALVTEDPHQMLQTNAGMPGRAKSLAMLASLEDELFGASSGGLVGPSYEAASTAPGAATEPKF